MIGVVAANAAGNFSFQIPAGIKNGNYTLEAKAISPTGSTYKLSVPVAFKVGPAPRVRPSKPKPKPKTTTTKTGKSTTLKPKVIQVQPRVVKSDHITIASNASSHLVDQAVHTLVVENRLFKKKGH